MVYSEDEEEFTETDINIKSEETSSHMSEYNTEIVKNGGVKYENKDCIDRNDDVDVKVLKCEEITIKSEMEESYNRDQKGEDPGAFQVQDFSVVLTRFDTKYQTKNTVDLGHHQLLYRPSSEVEKLNMDKTDDPSKKKSKPKTIEPLNKDGMFTCSQCDYKTKLKYYLKYHVLQHKSSSEVEIFSCSNCDYRTKNKRYLSIHKLRHKADAKVYKCSECQYKTVYTCTFHKHVLRHKADAKVYKCSECQYETVYMNTFHQHVLKHRKLSEVEIFTCNECNFQTKHKRNLISHKVLHTAEIFSCGQCNFQTKYKHSLKNHMQRHQDPTGLKETTFHMTECDTEIEGNNCVDIKEDFDVNLIECGNATIKQESESEYEYKVKIENDDCFKPEIENSSADYK